VTGVCGKSSRFDILLFHVFGVRLWFTVFIRLVCTYRLCSKTQPHSSCVWNTAPVTCQYGYRAGVEGARDIQENRETGEDFVV